MKKKSNKRKNSSVKLNYMQLSVPDFLDAYPAFASVFNPFMILEFLSDPDYVVRFIPGIDQFEFGFVSDDWELFK